MMELVDKLFEFVCEISSSCSVTEAGDVQSRASTRHCGFKGASMRDVVNGTTVYRKQVRWGEIVMGTVRAQEFVMQPNLSAL
jgi:hypothetical protein